MKIKLEKFLNRLNIHDCEMPEPNRWVITIPVDNPDIESFGLDIFQSDAQISFTSVVIENLSGKKLVHFYEFLFRLNHFLDKLKFAIDFDGRYIALQTEIQIADFDTEYLQEVIQRFIFFYTNWYSTIIGMTSELGLQFRKKSNKPSEVDKMLQALMASEILSTPNHPSLPSGESQLALADGKRKPK